MNRLDGQRRQWEHGRAGAHWRTPNCQERGTPKILTELCRKVTLRKEHFSGENGGTAISRRRSKSAVESQVLTHQFFFAYLSCSGNNSSGSSRRSNSRSIPGKAGGPQTRGMTGLAIDGKTGQVREEINVLPTQGGSAGRRVALALVSLRSSFSFRTRGFNNKWQPPWCRREVSTECAPHGTRVFRPRTAGR